MDPREVCVMCVCVVLVCSEVGVRVREGARALHAHACIHIQLV